MTGQTTSPPSFDDALPADTLIEIDDPAIDPAAVMNEIRRRIAQRRRELGYENRSFPSYGAAIYQGEPNDIAFDKDLNRTINVDIRYVLWCIDKLGGAKNIINELKLVR